jgi:hypothetical protein
LSLNRRSNLGGTERLAAPLLLGARLEQRLRQQVTGGGDRVRVGRNTFFPRTSDLGSSASPDQHLRVADSRYLDDSSSNNRPDSGLPGEPHASWLHGRSEIRTGRSSGLLRWEFAAPRLAGEATTSYGLWRPCLVLEVPALDPSDREASDTSCRQPSDPKGGVDTQANGGSLPLHCDRAAGDGPRGDRRAPGKRSCRSRQLRRGCRGRGPAPSRPAQARAKPVWLHQHRSN